MLGLAVEQAVLDGEALWLDEESPTFLFDILHVDGEDLLDMPLQERAASGSPPSRPS